MNIELLVDDGFGNEVRGMCEMRSETNSKLHGRQVEVPKNGQVEIMPMRLQLGRPPVYKACVLYAALHAGLDDEGCLRPLDLSSGVPLCRLFVGLAFEVDLQWPRRSHKAALAKPTPKP